MSTSDKHLSIGELARRAGVSVRALHHYDAIGLLSPSLRTAGGARRYGASDLARLHQVQALRQMGCSLPDIRAVLDGDGVSALALIERQTAMLDERVRQARRLSRGLRHLAARLAQGEVVHNGEWLELLELMTLQERHLSEAELDALRARETHEGGRLEREWVALVDEVGAAIAQRLPPEDANAQALAWRWVRLVIARTGNDAAIAVKLRLLHDSEPRAQRIAGVGPVTFEWIGQALAHARGALFSRHLSAKETREVVQRQLTTMAHMRDWPELVARMRERMEAGEAPASAPVRKLAARWRELWRDSLSGGDERLERKLRKAFAAEPELRLGVGVDEALLAYAQAALVANEPACAA
jgi:DNA-binding transcriptional MerR regulator